jgi:hypothetical protein
VGGLDTRRCAYHDASLNEIAGGGSSARLLPSSGGLAPQKRFLPFYPPPIAGYVAVRANDPVTRNDDGQIVRCARLGDGACRVWRSNGFGELCIASRLTEWDPPELLPHTLLESGSCDVHGYRRRHRARCSRIGGWVDRRGYLRRYVR